jgi:hypothetical protein
LPLKAPPSQPPAKSAGSESASSRKQGDPARTETRSGH